MKFFFFTIALMLSIIIVGCCRYYHYNKSIVKETRRIFEDKKKMFIEFGFTGIVKDKYSNANFNDEMWRIKISFNASNCVNLPNSINGFNHPYFIIDTNGLLKMAVSEDVFRNIEVGQVIVKLANSDSLMCGNNKYLLINRSKYKWVP